MNFSIEFSETALEDYKYWKNTNNIKMIDRIKQLLTNMAETPFVGIGKPEGLKYELSGYWSRRINKEHRIVYKVQHEKIIVIQLRGHY